MVETARQETCASIIPQLPPYLEARMKGSAHIHLAEGWSMIVKVVCMPSEIALVGRDIINHWRLVLDGREQILEIS
jgi:hypothetical protein